MRAGGRIELALSLAVIAEGRGLQHGRQSEGCRRGMEFLPRTHQAMGSTGKPLADKKRLLAAAVLRGEEHLRRRTHGHDTGEWPERFRRNVFKLKRHHVEPIGHGSEGIRIIE